MHLSGESVWRSLVFSSSGHWAMSDRTWVWPWCCCWPPRVTSGMTQSHYGSHCAIICKMVSKVPSSLDDLFSSPPPSMDRLLLVDGYWMHLWLTFSDRLIHSRHCSKCFTWPWPMLLSWLGIVPQSGRLLVWFPVTHIPEVWIWSPVGVHRRDNPLMFLSHANVSLPFFLTPCPPKINKILKQ